MSRASFISLRNIEISNAGGEWILWQKVSLECQIAQHNLRKLELVLRYLVMKQWRSYKWFHEGVRGKGDAEADFLTRLVSYFLLQKCIMLSIPRKKSIIRSLLWSGKEENKYLFHLWTLMWKDGFVYQRLEKYWLDSFKCFFVFNFMLWSEWSALWQQGESRF